MKWASTIWLLLLTMHCFAQNDTHTLQNGKRNSADHTFTPAALAQHLIANGQTEKEKVTAIFRWITDNIAYYRPEARKTKRKFETLVSADYDEDDNPSIALPPLTERVATKVLRDKRAVCEGYARLFKSLCDHAGIKAQIITGYARTKYEGAGRGFRSNHTWNAVCIENSWYLLDVTWASGYLLRSTGEFVRQYDDYYFLTSPEKFIEHHYPDDPRWALIDNLPTIPEFRQTPFKQKSFSKYSFTAFYPAKGIIETAVGDTIRLELETITAQRNRSIAGDSLWEEGALMQSPFHAYVQPIADATREKISYQFAVNSEHVRWLYVMYNNDAVLCYRLNVKKQNSVPGQ